MSFILLVYVKKNNLFVKSILILYLLGKRNEHFIYRFISNHIFICYNFAQVNYVGTCSGYYMYLLTWMFNDVKYSRLLKTIIKVLFMDYI